MIAESPVKYDAMSLETPGSVVSRVDESTIELRFKTDQLIVRKEAIMIDENLCQLAGGKPNYFIINALGIQSNMDTNALKYFSKESKIGENTLAAAILLDNLPIRLTASIFIKFHKPRFKTAIFKTKEEAQAWFKKMD